MPDLPTSGTGAFPVRSVLYRQRPMGDGRLLSVALTEQAVVERRKTVTRRLGWWADRNGRRLVRPGDRLQLVRKAMGRRAGEPVVKVAHVQVTDVARLQIRASIPGDAAREGFPDWSWDKFVEFFCREMRCTPTTPVTRIEWYYLDIEGPHDDPARTWFQVGVSARAAGLPRIRPPHAPQIPGTWGSWLDGWDTADIDLRHEG